MTRVSTGVYWLLGKHYGRPDWTPMNCLFMVVITLTTIGYGDWLELRNLHLAELFTMFLAISPVPVASSSTVLCRTTGRRSSYSRS